ncbi:MAG TPA: pantoate--beta-alanine ligase [Synergistaceae bacterium]|jgi:pantoate--beta-alanine ligase|nr:pantoate--beta-alanine ligase [Synergistales bacterium]MDN5335292.1 pantoate--beta-alanine ligase [Synergistales bacterium]HAA47372.1 pantoate--beta-alanine ligase [Synergistaceae bacterium]HAG22636.1 pantoate--beta-alanine ligase [Synergistaceae bacterium]
MKIAETLEEARETLRLLKGQDRPVVGLVPTMGFIHEGHLSLVRKCRKECTVSVVSVFVNPLQFGPAEDFADYPRDMERDVALLEKENVDLLFAPSVDVMYLPDSSTMVTERKLSSVLCGAARPGHFDGVCTVVLKLYNIVEPDKMYFGEKDYQQLSIIRRMMKDLDVPVEIVGCPIIREADGLAKSSRNIYLTAEERKDACAINEALNEAENLFRDGERKTCVLEYVVLSRLLQTSAVKPEYVEVRDAVTLEKIEEITRPSVIAVAARVGKARLIDNRVLR